MTDSPGLIHYTEGGPWFVEYQHCPYAEEWRRELEALTNSGK